MILTSESAKGGRLSVFSDGEYLFTVEPDIWYSMGFTDGEDITCEQLQEFKNTVMNRTAYSQALRLLTMRAHSSQELYNKLLKKHTPGAADFAIERCRELGFIDDGDFAAEYALELAEKKQYGPHRIKSALIAKGIDRENIEKALESLEVDYSESIMNIIEKKYSDCLSDESGRRKTVAALTRLGYSYADIKQVMENFKLSEDYCDEY